MTTMTTTNSTTTMLKHTTKICVDVPFRINSKGLWGHYNHNEFWMYKYSLPRLELQLVLFCLSMAVLRFLLKGFGVSKISSQIIVGLIFGCSWKQWDEERYKLFTLESQPTLSVLTYFGYILYLFVLTLKMNVRMIGRTKRKVFLIALPTLFGPLICGGFVANLLLKHLDSSDQPKIALMISFHSIVSLPNIENVLSELKILNSEIGHLGMSAALVGDMLSQLGLLITNIIRAYQVSHKKGFLSLGGFFLEVILILFVFKPAVVWMTKRTPKGKPVSVANIQAVICLVLLSSVVSVLLARPAISGPYLLGLAIPVGSPLIISLVDKLNFFVNELFIPLFIATSALQADFSTIFVAFRSSFTRFNIVVGIVTFSVKVFSSFVGSLYCNLPVEDSLALALLMSNKGIVELVFITMFRAYNIISDGLVIWLTVMVLVVSIFVPFPVRYLYDPSTKYGVLQNRNISNLPKNSELRVLVCVHQNKDTHGLIHLLNLSCPTKQNPLSIYVLHLVELVGKITPIFIYHKQENNNDNNNNNSNYSLTHEQESLSRNIVLCFENFERDQNGTVSVECFTTMTPLKFMLSEICKMGVEKTASLIILPYHQTWTPDGLIDQDDETIRGLNWGVIEKGPCSVGLFVNRGNLGSRMSNNNNNDCKSYSVCVIFLGGGDDREAISYAKRLTKNDTRVEMTVLRLFVSSTMEEEEEEEDKRYCKKEDNWEKMLDSEALREFKMSCFGDGRVKYIEGVSKDGTHTAMRVRKMVNEFDLMIVGRRKGLEESSPQTCGLNEWNDFPELGILGDLIVSFDFNMATSVLVIQQRPPLL